MSHVCRLACGFLFSSSLSGRVWLDDQQSVSTNMGYDTKTLSLVVTELKNSLVRRRRSRVADVNFWLRSFAPTKPSIPPAGLNKSNNNNRKLPIITITTFVFGQMSRTTGGIV